MQKTILIVDDNLVNRRILTQILHADYAVLEAQNGREALSLLAGSHQDVAAILLDIVMPVMDGYAVLESIRADAALSQIPIIVTTGNTSTEWEKKALSLGANDFVAKPYNPDILKRRLANLINLRETAAMVNALQKDGLTGVWNRETFLQKAARKIAEQPEGFFILACLDIDGFKVINDQYGTEKGDQVLCCLARALQEIVEREGGLCGRIAADNFIALFPRTALQKTRFRSRYLQEAVAGDTGLSITLSIGRYLVQDKRLSVSAMFDRASIAQATIKGRYANRIATYNETMRSDVVHRQEIVNDMNNALQTGQFEIWFQPQYNHSTGALIGAEALARWRHPAWGLVPPSDFIPVFEQNGFVYELDQYIWEKACAFLRKRMDDGVSPMPISVNISRHDLLHDGMTDAFLALTQKYGVPASLLRLEITESAFAESGRIIIDAVNRLIDHGFTIEIDDFGSGYSSLNTLKDVPAQIIKLDMRFLKDAPPAAENKTQTAGRSGSILESIVRMAKWLGMSVIAEGVETIAQADFLSSVGCVYVQGYLYSRPISETDYALLANAAAKERLIAMEAVENLDNNAFWDPNSMDTLIFNSYVGAASIFEYTSGKIELLRVSPKYARTIATVGIDVRKAMRLDWANYMDAADAAKVADALRQSRETHDAVQRELIFRNLPDCPEKLYLRFQMRVIATAGERNLVYCAYENMTAQREIEQKARETAELLSLVIGNVPGGVTAATVDGKKSAYLFANDQFYAMLGYTKEQFARECPDGLGTRIHPDDIEKTSKAIAAHASESGVLAQTFRVYKRDGSLMWMAARGSVFHMAGVDKPVHVAVHMDITAERSAAERLRIHEAELKIAMSAMGRPVCEYDISTKVLTLPEMLAARFGKPTSIPDAPNAVARSGIIDDADLPAFRAFFDAIRRGESPCSAEVRLKPADGELRWCRLDATVMFDEKNRPDQAIIVTTDITELREKETVFKRWQQSISEKAPKNYTLFRWNLTRDVMVDAFEGKLLHLNSDDMRARTFNENASAYALTHVFIDDRSDFLALLHSDALLAAYHRGKRMNSLEYREMTGDGVRWLRVTNELVEYPNSTEVEAYLMFENIDARKKADLLVREQAELDPLTGVLNRAAFSAQFDRIGAQAAVGSECALFVLDVDGFKLLNDTFGHAAGDQSLIDMANAIRSILRPSDLLGRLGGDEFLVGLKDMSSSADIERKARQICLLLRKAYSEEIVLSVSLGVAVCPFDGSNFGTIYRKADAALYYVKEAGKDNFAFYRSDITAGERMERVTLAPAASPVPRAAAGKRRMLIVQNDANPEPLIDIFAGEYTIETVKSGAAALTRLRHCGTAISIVLMDLTARGMDAFTVLEKMRQSAEMQTVPVIVISRDENRDAALRAIKSGAADFVSQPVDPDLIRIRVQSAVSKAENERLRAQNSFLTLQSGEIVKYRAALESTASFVIDYNWLGGTFAYDASVSEHIAGVFDDRALWRILLSDRVADAKPAQEMQALVQGIANDKTRACGGMMVSLKTPSGEKHRFRLHVSKLSNQYGLTEKLFLTFTDLDKAAANGQKSAGETI